MLHWHSINELYHKRKFTLIFSNSLEYKALEFDDEDEIIQLAQTRDYPNVILYNSIDYLLLNYFQERLILFS